MSSPRLDPLELVTFQDLAVAAKRSVTSLHRDRRAGRLRAVRLGSSWRVPRVEAERYLTGGSNGTPDD